MSSNNDETKQNLRAREKNAHVHQDRDRSAKMVHSQFDNIGLTKRNSEYMYKFTQAFNNTSSKLSTAQKTEIVNKMVQDLLEGQKSGRTARNMWGTVEQRVQAVLNPPKRKPDPKRDYWPNAGYNALLFLMIFTFMYGIIGFFPSKGHPQPVMGITGILISAAIAGVGIPLVTMMFTPGVKHKYSIWIRIAIMIVFVVVWMGVFTGAAMLPAVINPALNSYAYIVLGLLSAGGSWWYKRHFSITGGLF
ncbi:membrane protein [Lentilactobacillus fungorum]|uniref:Membrane protein n=1 Tax=Lentilactobacillus fungorum TaxID=2201250 RepID=A0ABQ3VYZ4_9LACO|nr:DUF1129 family protein [Lentilactobacillus fungorum]GHP13442.1 membrane protein [Lentilactobacillus fungorum]